ncbi:hypothetical protein Tco_1216920, partial [Tanacetum coccineum]
MKVEESLNVTFDETPSPPKTSPLEDDDLVEEEAIEVMAMQEELNQFISNDVWELVPNPIDMTIIGTKWVYRNKLDENGVVTSNKARVASTIDDVLLSHYVASWGFTLCHETISFLQGAEKSAEQIGANTAVVGEDGEVDSEGDAKFGQHMKTGESVIRENQVVVVVGETGCGNDNTTDSIFARRWLYEKWDGLLEIWSFMLFVLKTPLDIML